MRKAWWHPNLFGVFSAQVTPCPLAKSGRFFSQVNCNIKYFTPSHTDYFSLSALNLIMQPTQYTMRGNAVVVLNKLDIQTRGRCKVTGIETLTKEATCITKIWGCKCKTSGSLLGVTV